MLDNSKDTPLENPSSLSELTTLAVDFGTLVGYCRGFVDVYQALVKYQTESTIESVSVENWVKGLVVHLDKSEQSIKKALNHGQSEQ